MMVQEASTVAEELGIKLGDFFVCSWGYDQTNVDFYKVVGITAKSVKIQAWQSKRLDHTDSFHDAVVPGDGPRTTWPEDFNGDHLRECEKVPVKAMTKRIQSYGPEDNRNVYLTMNSYSHASPWDGNAKYQTAAGYGH